MNPHLYPKMAYDWDRDLQPITLVVKVPNRGLTFIVLANSDALAAPFGRDSWDVTASVFARLFLRVFLP